MNLANITKANETLKQTAAALADHADRTTREADALEVQVRDLAAIVHLKRAEASRAREQARTMLTMAADDYVAPEDAPLPSMFRRAPVEVAPAVDTRLAEMEAALAEVVAGESLPAEKVAA